MRRALLLLPLLAIGCTQPQVVDCEPGQFVRVDERAWCIYRSRHVCPDALPIRHDLSWGGRGCANDRVDPLPDDPCLQIGACDAPGDAG